MGRRWQAQAAGQVQQRAGAQAGTVSPDRAGVFYLAACAVLCAVRCVLCAVCCTAQRTWVELHRHAALRLLLRQHPLLDLHDKQKSGRVGRGADAPAAHICALLRW